MHGRQRIKFTNKRDALDVLTFSLPSSSSLLKLPSISGGETHVFDARVARGTTEFIMQ